MSSLLRQLFSLLLCAGLLAPIVERSIHSFEHRNDIHCTSSGKHFHALEHNCSTCDYDVPAQDVTSVFCDITIYACTPEYISNFHPGFSSQSIVSGTPRAPPVVA
jgi:hypothetical protein